MKKRLLITLLFSITTHFVQAQENLENTLNSLLKNNQASCEAVANKYALLFVNCFETQRLDLVPDVLKYWQQHCGNTEPLQRAKTLYAIEQKLYKDADIGYDIIDWVLNYQNRELEKEGEVSMHRYQKDPLYFGYVPIGERFDSFTKELASENKPLYADNSIEYAWCVFYSSTPDTIFNFIQKHKYRDSKLSYRYYNKVSEVKNMIDWHMAAAVGAWIPLGELSAMGVHPQLGVLFGGKGGKLSLDIDLSFHFLNSSHLYSIKQETTEYETKHFSGSHVGLNAGWDLYANKKNTLLLLAGIGWDGVETMSNSRRDKPKNTFISSYNFSLGLGMKHQISKSSYIGIHVKCNLVNYALNNVVEYKGMPLEVKLLLGTMGNPTKTAILKRLKHNQ